MMSNNPVINDHLPMEEASGKYNSNRKARKKGGNHPASNIAIDFFIRGVTYLLKNQSFMFKIDG
jgi:hypothetical protein